MDVRGGVGNEVLSSEMARELLISISYTLPEDIIPSSDEISSENLTSSSSIVGRNLAAASTTMGNGYHGNQAFTRSQLISISSSSIQSQDHATTYSIAPHCNGHL